MSTSTEAPYPAKKRDLHRKADIAAFWRFSTEQALLQDWERLQQIKVGLPDYLTQTLRLVFNLQDRHLKLLFNASISTLQRRRRPQKKLDCICSERLDRIAIVSHLTEKVFEDQERAVHWFSTPNQALGEAALIILCATDIGAKQVRRTLAALEWGGSA